MKWWQKNAISELQQKTHPAPYGRGRRKEICEIGETNMSYLDLREIVFQVAEELAQKGSGWAQQGTVLAEVARRIPGGAKDDRVQQNILTCWHDLFRDGLLSWGYNLDNPDAPFYHVPESNEQRKVAS
jgi:hypothetical protein